jgi:phosphopantetheinyl transferase
MPLFYQQDINENTKLAIWKIEENEDFFTKELLFDSNISHPTRRLQHFAGRYLLKFLYPEFPINQIKISESNKPFLSNNSFQFSISHTSNYAAAIVSKSNNVGIDIELANVRVLKVGHKFLSKTEMLLFKFDKQKNIALTSTSKQDFKIYNDKQLNEIKLFTILWSCKETIYKWWGKGEIDFKKMIVINHFKLDVSGITEAIFKQNNHNNSLVQKINYKLFEELCLTYTY